MWSSSPRDNWERLVAAVVKREQIWQLCHQDSITTVSTSFRSDTPSHFSEEILSVSSSRSKRITVSQLRQRPFTTASGIEFRKNASSTSTWKLFSALTRRMKLKDNNLDDIPEVRARRFSLPELQVATDNFHNINIVGRGSHCYLYKGRLKDGSLVAVKRLTADLQGFETELDVTSIASHRNVLRASGFCVTEKERLIVFPYMPNSSVASQLRERHESLPPLNWPVREKIALGAAKGLAYLHYECPMEIIHLDIKAANILLDEDFEAVVADFNLAKFMDCTDNDYDVRGTFGHIDPEYIKTGMCSLKNDVFSYGVFLLELITAQNSYDLCHETDDDDEKVLLDRVKRYYKEKKWKRMIDANLPGGFAEKEVEKMLQIALICTQTDLERRPTMLEVVRMLDVGYGLAEKWEEQYRIIFGEDRELRHIRSFTMQELRAATNDFSNKIISKDGCNMVYKGWITGSPVAVKRYNSQSLEDYFQKDLSIGKISLHPNIVRVIGFCHTPEEKLLVFHWMHKGSVASWLRGRHESQPPLTWQLRKNIAVGVARGLAYLHGQCEKKIIHRNVKAANILLGENFEAVVADFESAELLNSDENNVTTTVTGTIGHIAPEYLATGECSYKTDVFGYGAFLLELITGKETIDLLHVANDEDLVCADWVKRNYERRWELMVDKEAGGSIMEPVVEQLVRIAVLCTQYDPKIRPNMSEVARMLEVGGLAWRSNKRLEKSNIKVEEGNVPPNYNPNSEFTISEEQNLFSVLLSRRKPKNYPEYHFGLKSFSLQELHVATDHFSDKNIIRKGGKIYKGQLADGFLVAVKRRMPKDRVISLEELEISSIISHRYVNTVLGFCITKKEQLLVFPYMANGSVSSCLRERFGSQHPLSWEIRFRIVIKVARGLCYLHHDCPRPIIHCDITAANILLDEDFEAFVSNFSSAKFMDCNDVYDAVRGTLGHIDPEYHMTSKCSLKNDVHGYGVFLLELISGQGILDLVQLAHDDGHVVYLDWVKKLYEEKNFETMVDRNLEGNFMEEEVEMLLLLSLICTESDPERRPMMPEVVQMLEYGDGLAVYEIYLANQLHKSSVHIMDDSGFNVEDDSSVNLDDDEPLEPR